ncbi:hypothetical protein M409DRAFT_30750 [Zasmidium cellare ATCC 36951]|uniref:SnoaL-like domain-containing protein n=1 Tax=Zasmidium cellare ATCC 36951 TaxID=1080233 RepID=A0A6A6BW46_ZASCE|nr:uncharacterized protein M409DRAFT_30750 [Zasmidium cellare ATCC 36951]KAF2158793.1 hypothetical protein M409DRAFT_30750 [Zasmidium cellare ATCC 36951]
MRLTMCFIILAGLSTAQLTDWERIHQTLHRYAPVIDTKDFAQLDQIFSPNAHLNYTGFLSNVNGLPAIQAGLAQSVTGLRTQHLLGTTIIDIDHGFPTLGGKKANSTTYFQASLFAEAGTNLTTLFGYYVDDLSQGHQGWRIDNRKLVFQGTSVQGNAAPGPPSP